MGGMTPRNHAGMTLIEVIVLLVILLGVFLVMPTCSSPHLGTKGRGELSQALSNMKQLHLATQQMALDATTDATTNVGWPGNSGGTFTNWTTQLVEGKYLSKEELAKLLSGPGISVRPASVFVSNNTALLVYAVTEDSDGGNVFLSSANFTNTATGGSCDPSAKPFGTNGFVVFRKAGHGAILQGRFAGRPNEVGLFTPLCY